MDDFPFLGLEDPKLVLIVGYVGLTLNILNALFLHVLSATSSYEALHPNNIQNMRAGNFQPTEFN